jgi:hypothetical protein
MGFWEFIQTTFERALTRASKGNSVKNWERQMQREQYRKQEKEFLEYRKHFEENGKIIVQQWLERNQSYIDPGTLKIDIEKTDYNSEVATWLLHQDKFKYNIYEMQSWSTKGMFQMF